MLAALVLVLPTSADLGLLRLCLLAMSSLFTIGHRESAGTIQRIVGVLVQTPYSSGVKALFADFKPGAEKSLSRKFFDGKANGIRSTSEASVADRPAAHATTGKEFRLSVVIKSRHLVTVLTLGGIRRSAVAKTSQVGRPTPNGANARRFELSMMLIANSKGLRCAPKRGQITLPEGSAQRARAAVGWGGRLCTRSLRNRWPRPSGGHQQKLQSSCASSSAAFKSACMNVRNFSSSSQSR